MGTHELEFFGPLEGDGTVYDFVADLRKEGLKVEFRDAPADTTRGALESVATGLIVAGGYDLIKAAVARWKSAGRRIDLTAPVSPSSEQPDTTPDENEIDTF